MAWAALVKEWDWVSLPVLVSEWVNGWCSTRSNLYRYQAEE
jgi:hypothetical protein